jgi:hypothetical protein
MASKIKIVSEPYKNYGNSWDDKIFNIVVDIAGLLDSGCKAFKNEDNSIKVDADISDIIIALNKQGFTTSYSCSGDKDTHNERGLSPYISFAEMPYEKYRKIKTIMDNSGFVQDVDSFTATFRLRGRSLFSRSLDDATFIRSKWNALRKELGLL